MLTKYNFTDIPITTHCWAAVYKHTVGVCVVSEEVWAVLWTHGSLPVRGGGDQIWALITAVVSCSLPQSQHCDIHQGFSLFFFLSCFVFYQTGSDWSSPQSRWLLGDLRRFTVPPIPVSEQWWGWVGFAPRSNYNMFTYMNFGDTVYLSCILIQ